MPIMNHTIKFLVTEDQFTKIKHNAEARGFKTISQYLRHLALNKDLRFEKMLSEVHKKVIKK